MGFVAIAVLALDRVNRLHLTGFLIRELKVSRH
jgi:hypothetical protein